jgi:hypothetical protein
MQCPPQVNKSFVLSYDRFDLTLFESLPDFIKDKMKLSAEYVAMQSPNAIHADKEPVSDIADDLPF